MNDIKAGGGGLNKGEMNDMRRGTNKKVEMNEWEGEMYDIRRGD